MPFDASRYHRRSIRLKSYDYSQAGAYFVTVLTHDREEMFGAIQAGAMLCNTAGEIVRREWDVLEERYPNIVPDEFIVMPNHCHGIIVITESSDELDSGVSGTADFLEEERIRRRKMLLPKIIGYFKMNTAKQINLLYDRQGSPVWHRNYWEHIIRSERELEQIRNYIRANPMNWERDRNGEAFW